jgi:hypothetical protein
VGFVAGPLEAKFLSLLLFFSSEAKFECVLVILNVYISTQI